MGDLDRLAAAAERVQFADALFLPAVARGFVHRLGHAGLDQAGADGVDPDARSAELLAGVLDEVDDAGLGRRISRAARARSQTGDAGGADD